MNKWIISKIGLINFWYYDDEVFEFENGRLLLRGSNGSGKSVTMQSFIPLLLDGNRSARRLDPFGTGSRKIENYLLMEGNETDDRTGYLYMEFTDPETQKYITIGIGLRARKSKPVDFWGFSVTDGKRIGKDFFLYKSIGAKVVLSKRELKNRILEPGIGRFCERPSDYKAMVNEYIFGFEDLSEYDQLIDLLVQLRSPKLSKDYKPTVLYEIMDDSLKPLSDDDLRPMSEAIENMDNIEAAITELKSAYGSALRLRSVYDQYNSGVLYYKTEEYIRTTNELKESENTISSLQASIASNETVIKEQSDIAVKLNARRRQINDLLLRFRDTDVFKLNHEIEELEAAIASDSKKLSGKESSLKIQNDLSASASAELERISGECRRDERDMEILLGRMEKYADDADYSGHSELNSTINGKNEINVSALNELITEHYSELQNAVEAFKETESAQSEHEERLSEHAEEKNKYESIVAELRHAESTLDSERGAYLERLFSWNGKNEQMKLGEEILQNISEAVYSFDDFSDANKISAAISSAYGEITAEKNTMLNYVRQKRGKTEKQLAELEASIKALVAEPYIAPELTEEQIRFRQTLDEAKIPYLPLYLACNFDESLTEDACGMTEEALAGMGLLNALVIPRSCSDKLPRVDGASDRFIVPTDYSGIPAEIGLRPEENNIISPEDIRAAFAGISSENSDLFINRDGSYGISVLRGFTSGSYTAKYIGEKARARHKASVLEEMNRSADALADEFNRLSSDESRLERELIVLEKEFQNAPGAEELAKALSEIKSLNLDETASLKRLEALKERVRLSGVKLSDCRTRLDTKCGHFRLERTLSNYRNAVICMDKYKTELVSLVSLYKNILSHYSTTKALSIKLTEYKNNIYGLYDDISDLTGRISEAMGRKQNCEERRKQSGFDDDALRMSELQSELDRIPAQLDNAAKARYKAESDSENIQIRLDALEKARDDLERKCSYTKEVLCEELALDYCGLNASDVKGAVRAAAQLRTDKPLSELRRLLTEKYYDERVLLTDYSVTASELFNDTEQENGFTERSRLRLTARIRGTEVDFYELITFLEKEIAEKEELLTQKDKELFEDLLIDTVGRKMRSRISSSERWVSDMNKKMLSMDTSSGLRFSLEWKSKPADNEDQMNTRQLVELLKRESRLLDDSDTQSISKHFRSKLKEARLRRDEGSDSESMHTILKDILDYRKWFEFRLYYRITGEAKKELTNNAFYRFSGGEKAMAMYVPLFASVYARYAKAAQFAPRLISLDEAFAGIDDKNIADMFRLMEELGLSYIINSQVLWGTYKTVPSLSICELIRPNNSSTVSVVRYKWNGKSRELVL